MLALCQSPGADGELGAWPVSALVGPGRGADPPPPDPTLERVRALADQGAAALEAGDPLAAVAAWTQAYYALPPGDQHDRLRADLLRRLAAAHDLAYDVDGDLTHLETAVELLSAYLEVLPLDDVGDRELIAEDREHADRRLEQARAAIRDAQIEQQQNRSAYANARVRRMFTANEKRPMYTVGMAAASMDVAAVMEHIGEPERAQTMRRRRRGQIAMYALGGALWAGGLALDIVAFRGFGEAPLGQSAALFAGGTTAILISSGMLIGAPYLSEVYMEEENLEQIERYNQTLQREYEIQNPNTIWSRREPDARSRLSIQSIGPTPLSSGAGLSVRGAF